MISRNSIKLKNTYSFIGVEKALDNAPFEQLRKLKIFEKIGENLKRVFQVSLDY